MPCFAPITRGLNSVWPFLLSCCCRYVESCRFLCRYLFCCCSRRFQTSGASPSMMQPMSALLPLKPARTLRALDGLVACWRTFLLLLMRGTKVYSLCARYCFCRFCWRLIAF